jgi:hypothetical protein
MDEEISINTDDFELARIPIRIKGKSPMLQNKMSERDKRKLKAQKTSKTGDKNNPVVPEEVIYERCHIISGNGVTQYGVPSVAIKMAIVEGGYGADIFDSKAGPKRAFQVEGEAGELCKMEVDADPVVDERRVDMSRNSSEIKFRPRFELDWFVDFEVKAFRSKITPAQILEATEVAGEFNGIGSYRAQNGGPFGKFKICKVGDQEIDLDVFE